MAWTEAKVELAKSLWLEGWTAPAIAAQLGNGFSRNAVIGKMHRLGLVRQKSPPEPEKKPKTESKRLVLQRSPTPPVPYKPMPVPKNMPKPKNLTLMQRRDDQCHFLTGDARYCGHPVRPGTRYCEGHCQIVYMPRVARR
jgi:GcrA cell cycle regulator